MSNSNQHVDSEEAEIHGNVMAWALRNSNVPEHIHISAVKPDENGLKCDCICIGCGQQVMAVNANKGRAHFEVPGTQQKHFKHRNVALNDGQCNQLVASKVALRLFAEQSLVELPGPSRKLSRTLPNGEVVQVQSHGEMETMHVVQRVWINDLNVKLLGEDGRECLVTVRSQHSADEHGSSTCILSLHNVLAPSLVNLSSEQILTLLNDPVRGPRWLRHREFSQLDSANVADLKRQEQEFYGDIPDEWLHGLTGKLKGETVLHWLIKRAISNIGQIKVPPHSVAVEMKMPDGTKERKVAICQGGVLILRDVRIERRLGSMVPDVMCRAYMRGTNLPAVDLLIEAGVTHYVDTEKRQKIMDLGLACLEVRADRFQEVGRVPASLIEGLVGSDSSTKSWVVHPWMDRHIKDARDFLTRRAKLIAEALQDKRAAELAFMKDRQRYEGWTRSASNLQLAKGYLKILQAYWEGRPKPVSGTVEVKEEDLWRALEARGVVNGTGRSLEGRDSMLHLAFRIDLAEQDDELDVLVDRFQRAVSSRFIEGGAAVVWMFGLDTKTSRMSPETLVRYQEQRRILLLAIDAGSEHTRRDTRFDRLLSLLFPALGPALQSELATDKHLAAVRLAAEGARTAAIRRREVRSSRIARVKEGRAHQEEQTRRRLLEKALSDETGAMRWCVGIHDFPNILMLIDRHRAKLIDADALKVFKAAREAIAIGESVESAFRRFGFSNANDVKEAVGLLVKANLCKVRG